MGEMGDRIDRAERYVLGLMNDEERERAERDLEIDPAFRDAMVVMAERMHVFDHVPMTDHAPEDQWRLLKQSIEALPQMRTADAIPDEPARDVPEKPVTFGRRRTDYLKVPAAMPEHEVQRVGLHSVPGRKAFVLALCLIAAFVLDYVTGRL